MILKVFAVRDRATDQYGNPMFLVNAGQAIRSFSDEVNKNGDGNMLAAHPDDFDLYELGSFDCDTGLFSTVTPRQVAVGKDLVLPKK